MLALAQRDRQALAVAIIDLDHFKAVNDRYGHGAGDTLLAAFGRLLARALPQERRRLPLWRRGVLPADAAHRRAPPRSARCRTC